MELSRTASRLQLRLSSCLETVLEIQRILDDSELVLQLEVQATDLRALLENVDSLPVAEYEVSKLESATNRLLEVLKPVLDLTGEKLQPGQVLN